MPATRPNPQTPAPRNPATAPSGPAKPRQPTGQAPTPARTAAHTQHADAKESVPVGTLFQNAMKIIATVCGPGGDLTLRPKGRSVEIGGFFAGSEAVVTVPIEVEGMQNEDSVSIPYQTLADVTRGLKEFTLTLSETSLHVQSGRTKLSLNVKDGGYFPTIVPLTQEMVGEQPLSELRFTPQLYDFMKEVVAGLTIESLYSTFQGPTLLVDITPERRIAATYDGMQLAYLNEPTPEDAQADLRLVLSYADFAAIVNGVQLTGSKAWITDDQFVSIGPNFRIRRLLPILSGAAAPDVVLNYIDTIHSYQSHQGVDLETSSIKAFMEASRTLASTGEPVEFLPTPGKGYTLTVSGMAGKSRATFKMPEADGEKFSVNFKFMTSGLTRQIGAATPAKGKGKKSQQEDTNSPQTASLDIVGDGRSSARFIGERFNYVCLLQADQAQSETSQGEEV